MASKIPDYSMRKLADKPKLKAGRVIERFGVQTDASWVTWFLWSSGAFVILGLIVHYVFRI